ncbi:MAG TPA: Gfo/Idh/MocA family oxidoreductase [Mycobacteriales bacterium]|nr:Gfo/Idh/MocA family oxidoreductase [Mycobacteriales bacterium]
MPGAKLKYGLIGTGQRGCKHIEVLRQVPEVEIVAVSDPHRPSVDRALAMLPEPASVRTYSSYLDLLADPGLDAVLISSPNHTHVDVIADAVRYDKHIYVEKPLAHTPEGAARIVELVRDFEKIFWVGLQYRYMPPVAYLRDRIEGGDCGAVKMLTIREHRGPFRDKVGNWNRFSRWSGGTLVEKCCHYFDLLNLLAGSRPLQVYASGAADVNHQDERYEGERPDIIDNAYVIVDYEAGIRALLDLCMFHPAANTHAHMFVSATGDGGYAHAKMPSSEVVVERFAMRQAERVEFQDPPEVATNHSGSDLRAHQAFAQCLIEKGNPEVDVDSAALSVYVGAAAERSIEWGRVVTIAEVQAGSLSPDA